ncbi:hypothetical protein OS493_002885 [Desmophyllum pertusum]|uniref:Uncharacterized protein n=1 Tax=Desmophyllum pertusum TaxID=174260 RepID=A0A9W9YJJ4_9CNID|nr:hypothetical protein OS493_002885 [Desmophyllum pertusum]
MATDRGRENTRTYWLVDHEQRMTSRPHPSPKKLLSRRRRLFSAAGDGKGLKPSCITRSATLRRSLKAASENPMTKLPFEILIDDLTEKDDPKRKASTHSITRV